MWEVTTWGSEPLKADDCWTGAEYTSEQEAREVYSGPQPDDAAWVMLTRDGVTVEARRNPGFTPCRDSDDAWRQEIAMQAGMAFGCQGYNEVMGWN